MRLWIAALCLMAASCAGAGAPANIELGQDACAECRMVIVSLSTAAQIVTPGEEPRFFDEIGCLRDYMSNHVNPPAAGTVVYVADHQTGRWLEADRAVFTRTAVSTPMASGILAHADVASRDADPAARGGAPVSIREVLGSASRSAAP